MLSEEFRSCAAMRGRPSRLGRPRYAFLRLFDTSHRDRRGAHRVWLYPVAPIYVGLTASDELYHATRRSACRPSRPISEKIIDRHRRVLSFAPGSIFAFVRWPSNDFGTILSRINILRAAAAGLRFSIVPWISPGGESLLRLSGTHRRNLKRKFLDLENAIRHSLKAFGIRLHRTGRRGFAKAVPEAVAGDAWVTELIDAMLGARAAPWKECGRLHDPVVKFVAGHELCRRFMQIPGVGPVAALSFVTAIDDPSRFKRSRDVTAYFGLTSRRWQSGSSIDVQGRISKAGDSDVRRALYEAASALLARFKRKDKVKSWGLAIAKRSSHRKATVVVARKLAVIMHAMWVDGTFYCADPAATPAEVRAHAAEKERKLLRTSA